MQLPCWDFGDGWQLLTLQYFLIVKTKVIPEFYEAALMTGSSVGKRERVHDINITEAKILKSLSGVAISGS